MKICPKCSRRLGPECFHKDANRKDGLACWCRDCCASKARRWYAENHEEVKASNRVRYYERNYRITRRGLTLEEYNELLALQGGKCAVCGCELLRPQIDHCHRTDRVRGVLCTPCNIVVGWLESHAERAVQAAAYLARFDMTGA